MRERRPFTITKLSHEAGFWTANVTVTGETVAVDRKFGSWQADHGTFRRDVRGDIAAALQAKVRPLERKPSNAEVPA